MWNDIVKHQGKFSNAVLTGLDAGGYPFSVRCTSQIDESNQVLKIMLPEQGLIRPGPAGLLYHSHNAKLWDLLVMQVLGRLEQAEQSWVFHPERFIPGPVYRARSLKCGCSLKPGLIPRNTCRNAACRGRRSVGMSLTS
jgi:hypothetical protein